MKRALTLGSGRVVRIPISAGVQGGVPGRVAQGGVVAHSSSRSRRDLIRLAGGGVLLGTGGAAVGTALLGENGDVFARGRLFVRRNVYGLAPNGPELSAYRRGIEVMQQRPMSDPTSWLYQANIHGTSEQNVQPAWNSCEHSSWFFPSWHRMYLYWFEWIVRKASGSKRFALPYWNYEKAGQAALPSAFRQPADGSNALYVEERRSEANEGSSPPASQTSSRLALKTRQFISTNSKSGFGGGAGFLNGEVEQTPHNTMHGWVSGLMGAFETAAQDPIFWLHHANIDRLWEVWLKQGDGRANPTKERRWLNERFLFFDEDGQRIEMSGREIVDTVGQLDYRYDQLPGGGRRSASSERTLSPAGDGEPATLAVGDAVVLTDRRSTVTLSAAAGAKSLRDSAAPVLELTDVTATVEGGFAYEVYVGLKAGAAADFRDPSFVGNLSSFGMPRSGQAGHAGHGGMAYQFAIEGGLTTDAEATVTFVPVVTPEQGNRGGNARIGRIAITG